MTAIMGGVTQASGLARLIRSSLFAVSAVWLSLVAHVAGGGSAPSAGLVLALIVLITAVTAMLAGRRRGHLSIAAVLLALQVLLHHAFAMFATGLNCRIPAPGGHHAGAPHHAGMNMTSVASGCSGQDAMASTGSGPAGMTASMLTWHVLAGLVLALLLSHGERTVWLVLTWFLPPLPSTHVPAAVPVLAGPALSPSPFRPRIGLLSGGVGRRGPPRVVGAPA